MDENAVEKAYAKNQVTKVMTFDEFVKHIAEHNGVFTRGTVKGVVSDTCSCLVEMLLNGNKVQFGELGVFGISITSDPAETLASFTAANIKEVNILFTPGKDFENLRSRAEFIPVPSRAAQQATLKAERAGETTVDLEAAKNKGNANGGSAEDTDETDVTTGTGSSAPTTPSTGGDESGNNGGSGEE